MTSNPQVCTCVPTSSKVGFGFLINIISIWYNTSVAFLFPWVYQFIFWNSSLDKVNKHEREVAQSCLTLCGRMDCSLRGSSVHGIFQAIVLEWIAISFSKGSSQPRDRTRVSGIVDRYFTVWSSDLYTSQYIIFIVVVYLLASKMS